MSETNELNIPLVRPTSPELEPLLGHRYSVLDDGFVRVVDYLGTDASIVQAARVSYGAGTKAVSEDRALIRYLMRNRHSTPFEMCEIKLHVRVPMDTWRQWVRHRTANINEYSTRYSVAIDAAQMTCPDRWRLQSATNKQGSAGYLDVAEGEHLTAREAAIQREARSVYAERLARGVAREQARKDLPLSTYTEAYWKIDLHNLLHFLSLRMDEHAQEEIRAYASVIGRDVVAKWVPLAWDAFVDFRLKAITFGGSEIDVLGAMLRGDKESLGELLERLGWTERKPDGRLKLNRERSEFAEKYRAIVGSSPEWARLI